MNLSKPILAQTTFSPLSFLRIQLCAPPHSTRPHLFSVSALWKLVPSQRWRDRQPIFKPTTQSHFETVVGVLSQKLTSSLLSARPGTPRRRGELISQHGSPLWLCATETARSVELRVPALPVLGSPVDFVLGPWLLVWSPRLITACVYLRGES